MTDGKWMQNAIKFVSFTAMIFAVIACGNKQNESDTAKMQRDVTVPQGKTMLWNGSDFSNWVFVLEDTTVDPMDVWSIKDGVIHCAGNPFGYMRTKAKYSNYALHVEWRWPKEKTNSGVFLFMNGPDKVWPDTLVECQLEAGNAGDFVSFPGLTIHELAGKNSRVIPKKEKSNERPIGEWNTYDIRCSGDSVKVYVNGTFQNEASGFSVTSGSIGIQSEGKGIEFRNVYVEPL